MIGFSESGARAPLEIYRISSLSTLRCVKSKSLGRNMARNRNVKRRYPDIG